MHLLSKVSCTCQVSCTFGGSPIPSTIFGLSPTYLYLGLLDVLVCYAECLQGATHGADSNLD
jgi:hypothetical protein